MGVSRVNRKIQGLYRFLSGHMLLKNAVESMIITAAGSLLACVRISESWKVNISYASLEQAFL